MTGTKDGSMSIIEKHANKDERIKIIEQNNQGLSEARNTGIVNAKGEFICFVDADDFVHEDYIRLLVEDAVENDVDISVCDFWYIDEQNNQWNKKSKERKIYLSIEAIKDILTGEQKTEIMAWNKLYRLKLFKDNNIKFPKGKIHEDNFTTYKLYYYANKISLITDKLYYYLQRPNSIMGRKFNIKRLDILKALEETKEFFKNADINLGEELECYEICLKLNLLNKMIYDNFDGDEKQALIKQIIEKKGVYLKNKYTPKGIKIVLRCLYGKGMLYKIFLIQYKKLKMKR